jgi:flagellar hook-associated protein 1 FlgK
VGDLFSALRSAASALDAFQRAVDVTQNNVTNANSPGYTKQTPSLVSRDFQTTTGITGGVQEITRDTRNSFADGAVQQQLSLLGQFQQLQTSLGPLQTVLDVSSNSAIPTALSNLFQSFSQWSVNPSDTTSQALVISAAQQAASAFQQTAAQLTGIRSLTDKDLQSTVDKINQDAQQIVDYNQSVARDSTPDAGRDARLHAVLEDLSSLADIQVIPGIGSTVTVLLGGQTPLVIGSELNALEVEDAGASNPVGPANKSIVDSSGRDVSSQVTSGSLYALLNVRNNLIPSLAGGGQQAGDLNMLAQGLADTVNGLLAQGTTSLTPPYAPGAPLFTYNSASPSNVAASLGVNPTLLPGQLAGVDPGPPFVANGIALMLAGLDNDPNGQINGLSFTRFFSTLASRVGNESSRADTSVAAQTQLVAQAKSLRQQLSGVSIDEEAVRLIQLQSSYQAASKVVTVIDQLTQALINMVN